MESIELTAQHFEHLVGQNLTVSGSTFAFTVVSVDRLKSPSPRAQAFSVSLLAPENTRGGQGIYHLEHPELGVLEIFLVPIEPKGGRSQFEAVFN